MQKIRYKYKEFKEGFELKNVKCPTCGGTINWIKVVQPINWNGTIILLAECWSRDISEDKPRHIFTIELDDLPNIQINKVKEAKNGKTKKSK